MPADRCDELFTERPRSLLAFDVALQAQQTPARNLSGADFVYDGPPSANEVNEIVGQFAPSRVLDLGNRPVLVDARGGGLWLEAKNDFDLSEGDLQPAQCRHEACSFELSCLIEAIPRVGIDRAGWSSPSLS